MILAITLFLFYSASAWAMLRSATKPRLELAAWALVLVAMLGHLDAIMHIMLVNRPFSIVLF